MRKFLSESLIELVELNLIKTKKSNNFQDIGKISLNERPRHNQSFWFIMYVFPLKPRFCAWCGG